MISSTNKTVLKRIGFEFFLSLVFEKLDLELEYICLQGGIGIDFLELEL